MRRRDGLHFQSCKRTMDISLAARRLNILAIFVTGGPTEAGKVTAHAGSVRPLVLVDPIVAAAGGAFSSDEVTAFEEAASQTCMSCLVICKANSMNSLKPSPCPAIAQ